MFRRSCFDILLVDDDTDVLQISSIALKNLRYANAPMRIHTFASKHAAIEFMQNMADPTTLALILTDVVMETDTAGLELCSYLRTGLKNDVTQLIVRTGQAARAPQRQVLEAYEVNGYVAKGDMSQDALANVVIGALRNYEWSLTALLLYRLFNTLLPGFRSREDLLAALRRFVLRTLEIDASLACDAVYMVDDATVAFGALADPAHAQSVLTRVRALEGRKLTDAGDLYRIEQDDPTTFHVLFELGMDERKLMPAVSMLATVRSQPPEVAVTAWTRALYAVRRLVMIADFIGRLRGGPEKAG